MNNQQVINTLIKAGIDPARVFVGLKQPYTLGLRAPTANELAVIREFVSRPLVGADSPMAPVFAGWNVWAVWQVMDLPFSVMMVGVSRDSQLKIWVEDQVRLHAPGAEVADPLDLKGGQVEILTGSPGLQTAMRKENVPGPALVVETQDVAPQLRFVRFFNRGAASELPWPHDESYLLDAVFRPDAANSATKGSGPGTILDRNITGPAGAAGKTVLEVAAVAALLAALGYAALQGLKHK
jgi:hypothetical protein